MINKNIPMNSVVNMINTRYARIAKPIKMLNYLATMIQFLIT